MNDTVKSYSLMLRQALGDRLAPEAQSFFEMVAPDGAVEFPFALPGFGKRLEGRDALAAHLKRVGGRVEFHRMSEPIIYQTSDPEVLIIEFDGFGRGVETGEPYEQSYVAIIRTRGGHIIHIREYWNPIQILRTLKGLAEVEALTAGVWPD